MGVETTRGGAGRARDARRSRERVRPPRRLRLPVRPRILLGLGVLLVAVFLYARPIASYLDTRQQLAERRAEVIELRAERARVTARLQQSTSLDALARDARRIGQV
ncbi:MAG: septum formation initiator family protein, partial [Gaiella sp.]